MTEKEFLSSCLDYDITLIPNTIWYGENTRAFELCFYQYTSDGGKKTICCIKEEDIENMTEEKLSHYVHTA